MLVRDKRALSNLVAYVLLIAITISLSVIIYGWLTFYVTEDDTVECPDNVDLIISSYECVSGSSGYLTLTLRNKGLFTIDGYVLTVHNRTGAEFGLYDLDVYDEEITPGESISETYSFSGTGFSYLTLVDVSPYMDDTDVSHCESYVVQEISCEY